jgi:hypothetical protein
LTPVPQASQLPPRLLPTLYFAASHIALALAFGAVAWDPLGVAGFFYHARMLAVVHLVTLGWITSSILGALYLVGPIALRVTFSARWTDYTAFALVAIGIIGMVAHFWIAEYGGMAWSAATVTAGILIVAGRVLPSLSSAPVPRAVKGHVALAFLNVAGAATMGVLIAFNKIHPFLPGYVLSNVFAHAHLAAVGWASMMVVGVAYRLLPMVLPSEMPSGAKLWATAIFLQIGVTGLFVALVSRRASTWPFAVSIVAGFALFVAHAAWMVRHPRPRPPAIRTPDPAVLHAAAALCCLLAASGLGLWLSAAPTSDRTLRVAMAYGVFGLVGFLGQMVIAMEGRLLPLFAWYWAFANTGSRGPVISPHEMPWRTGQYLVFALWLAGIPAMAIGLALDGTAWVRAGGYSLLAATILDSVQVARILRHAYARPRLR